MKKNGVFRTVFLKELRDLFRDKKTIIATVLVPLIIYPVIMFIIGGGLVDMYEEQDVSYIAVAGELSGKEYLPLSAEDKAAAEGMFGACSGVEVKSYPDTASVNAALENGDISMVLTVQAGIADILNGGVYRIGSVYDARSSGSMMTVSAVLSVVESYAAQIYRQRLAEDVTDTDKYTAVEFAPGVSLDDIKERTGTGNTFLIMLIPMLVTVLVSAGGASVAVDLIAGEKERGTFEPLLSTSANRFLVLSAKYAVVVVFALINAVVQVIVMSASIMLSPQMREIGGSGLNLGAGGIILGIINILLLAAVFCSVMLCLASTSKSFKEASTKTSFLVMLPLLLSYTVMFKDAVNIPLSYMLIPVINVVSVIKMILSGYVNYSFFALSAAVNLALLFAAVYLTFKMFSKESLITRG